MDVFSTQDILEFDERPILHEDIDGEVSTLHYITLHYKHSPCNDPQCIALAHALYTTTDSAHRGQSFVSPLYVNPEPLLFPSKVTEIYIDVIEVPPQGSSGVLHSNYASLQGDVDISRMSTV